MTTISTILEYNKDFVDQTIKRISKIENTGEQF